MYRGWLSIAVACFATGCTKPLDVGTDIIWSTDFETGDFSAWSTPPDAGGVHKISLGLGSDAASGNPSYAISDEQAHSGRYSAKLTSTANLPDGVPTPGGGSYFYRQAPYPKEAYYSAWYYLPQAYVTTTSWTILSFKGVEAPGDLSGVDPPYSQLFDLDLASLPGGSMTLVLFDNRQKYLTSPLPDPVPIVPIGQWFQIECFYRNSADPDGAVDLDGELTVWLNGTLIYDVVRQTGMSAVIFFSPCSIVYDLAPPLDGGVPEAELYIDDVAISWTRLTPHGILKVPN